MDINIIIGILLMISFFCFIVYCIKGYNLMIGVTIIALIWTFLPLIGNFFSPNEVMESLSVTDVITTVFQSAPESWGTILVNILWGAWFGRVLLETGIASTLIKRTIELGGSNPVITMILLNIATAIMFTSMTGAGPVIAIAVIVMPILLSLGIPKTIALFTFLGSVMAGLFLNIVNFNQYYAFFAGTIGFENYTYQDYFPFALIAFFVSLVIVSITASILLNTKKVTYNWALSNVAPDKDVPGIALIVPILPVVGVIGLSLPVIFGFMVSGFFALLVCKKLNGFKDSCLTMNKLFTDGAVDTAPLMGFLLCLAAFNSSANFVAPYFQVILGGIVPSTQLGIFILFIVLVPLGYFRGPMNLVGSGAATVAVITAVTNVPMEFLFPFFAITTIVMQHFDITQSWVAWGMGYAKVDTKEYIKIAYPVGWLIAVILCIIAYI